MRKFGLILMTLAVCWGGSVAASADQLYIHNKAYKGSTTGSGKAIQAELQGLVQALGLTLTEVSSNWIITAPGGSATLPAGASGSGKLYYAGKSIGEVSSATSMITVKILADAVGATVAANKGLGTVDVAVPAKFAAAPAKRVRQAAVESPRFRLVAFDAAW